MRLHRIEIEGFGPFRARQTIDLDAYAGDGIFLISGRTGAGKSSILDAVCFALYGSTPRYERGEARLRSDHAEPDDITEVALEFTTGGRTWRIERSPDYMRPKRRGDGFTPQKAEARMGERAGDDWDWQAARPVDVANLVDEIVGLNQQQFLQVILLAQGRFARFLLAKNDERQALLRTLFGTRRFEEYETALDERRKDAVARVEREAQALAGRLEHAEGIAGDILDPLDGAPELADRIEWVGRASLRARHLTEETDSAERQAAAALAAAEALHAERSGQRDRQQRRDESRRTLADLEAKAEEIALIRAERDAARSAEHVRGARDAATRALVALNVAEGALAAARSAWGDARDDVHPPLDAAPDALDVFVAEGQQRIGAWRPVRDIETGLAAAAEALEGLRAQAEDAARRDAALEERAAALPRERERVEAALVEAMTAAANIETLRQAVTALDAQLAAARSLDRLVQARARAYDELQRAKRRKDESERHLAELQRRRFAGMAGELAADLIDGEACAVCGSTSHPAPAARGDDAVTVDDIERADAARAEVAAAFEAANTALTAADRTHADAERDAGGREADEIAGDLEDTRTALADAEAAVVEKERLVAARAALDAEASDHAAAKTALVAERSELDARIAGAAAALEKDGAAVAEARGAATSVAARIEAEDRLVRVADAYADAQREAVRAEKEAVDARDALQASAEQAGFADPAEALAALREQPARAALEDRIHAHDTALAATRSALLQLELDALPEEPVDTAESAASVAAAKQAWAAAVEARTAASHRARALADAAERAVADHAQIAGLAAEAAAIRRLADTVAGRAPNAKRMKLETFVLAAELEEIVAAANVRLADMSGARYRLQHSDAVAARGAASGLGLEVMDAFTGRARPAHSLSGGETFLASLALALGLAEVVTSRAGGIRLDTLFIDEGFGSLDAETLDTAMRTLDELRQGGRTVGIISHVDAMKEQIPAQLRVEQTPQGWSRVVQEASLPA
ncbi:AAA family ATPase [Microbacterium marinilacus]|uniref:Nuclease SbcCD subunit C n=1 Tax=Microbacterium marinilacus TaxID=415209 RepID=A0ABP7BGL5_9MICO|nr:SMC family ATPase [Microbacterium marinilacus]MBY0689641.1 SMC family ATPase [Microbacterium marinilacus]